MKPGTRVKVFDHRLYKDDKTTPLSITMQPATVLKRYKYPGYPHEDVVDVEFDYRLGEVSKAHFINSCAPLGD
jgi:hypothetical protein